MVFLRGLIGCDLSEERLVKCEPVSYFRKGHVKLADFGSAARIVDGKVQTGMPVGTPDYIAPEVLQVVSEILHRVLVPGL